MNNTDQQYGSIGRAAAPGTSSTSASAGGMDAPAPFRKRNQIACLRHPWSKWTLVFAACAVTVFASAWFLDEPSLNNAAASSPASRIDGPRTTLARHYDMVVTPARLKLNLNLSGRDVSFNVRSFNGSIPGPTVSAYPGDTLIVRLHNRLGGAGTPECERSAWNTERCPNITSLHAHGLHVSPGGNADNVLEPVLPGKSRTYEYHIRRDHPPGTYWLHAHFHGSSAYQTAYAMAAPLLVLDLESVGTTRDVVMLVQNVIVGSKKSSKDVERISLEAGSRLAIDEVPALSKARNIVCVNGAVSPALNAPSTWTRWRIIGAAIDGYLVISMQKRDLCRTKLIAADGKYLSNPRTQDVYIVPPGGRIDLLVKCKGKGKGALVSGLSYLKKETAQGISRFLGPGTGVLSGTLVRIISNASSDDFVNIANRIGTGSKMQSLGSEIRPLTRAAELDHDDLRYVDNVERRTVEWTVDSPSGGSGGKVYGMNGRPFSMNASFTVKLGQVYEWKIVNRRAAKDGAVIEAVESHPFHMHTNKFQVVAAHHDHPDSSNGEGLAYEIGEWRDTVPIPTPGYLVIRFRPKHYEGKSLAHCHILLHEDKGMMMAFEIAE